MSSPPKPLLDWLEAQIFGGAPFEDVVGRVPDFSDDQAYAARAELVRRRVAAGDALAGYKVAGSSLAVRKDEHVEGPIMGCIMRSRVLGERVPAIAGRRAIEAEIGVLVGKDLSGPGVNLIDAHAAVEGAFPAFEILSMREGPRPSHPARIVASNFAGAFAFGETLKPLHGLDLRSEGVVLSVNGEVRGSATAIEVLGHPLRAVAFVANQLARVGQSLRAGMVVMTGSILANAAVAAADRVEARFSRLGDLSIVVP
ncbi:MAG TPA: fumarylacetoacetate hydrolase family protein [Burkholderiales bacterium]